MERFGCTKSAAVRSMERGSVKKRIQKYRQIYLLMLPGILFFILFKLMPLWGLGVAFVDFDIMKGLTGSQFVGLKHFRDFLRADNFGMILRNTLVISFMDILFAFPAPILLSLLLNEVRRVKYKSITQSIIYMPHFMSWAVIAGLTFFLFSTDVGLVNKFLHATGGRVYPFLTNKNAFWWVLLGQNLWKEVGWGTIIYLASISQVDQGMYEAARIDGATRLQQICYVTIPALVPTIIVLFLMRLGKIMDVSFEQVWMMQNDMVRSVSETFETYSFQVGVQMGNYSVGTAVGLFKSAIGLITVLLSNWAIKKTGNEGIF